LSTDFLLSNMLPESWELDRLQTALLAAILALTVAASLGCLANGFAFDDEGEIVNNRFIDKWSYVVTAWHTDAWWCRNPSASPQCSYYRPMQTMSVIAGYQLCGRNPRLWHGFKIVLHLIAVIAAFRLTQLLTRGTDAALVAALLFGVYPPHAEAVAWISALPQVVAAILEMSAMCLIVQADSQSRFRIAPIILAGLAMFTYEGAIVFPVIVAAYFFFVPVPPASTGFGSRLLDASGRAIPYVLPATIYLGARFAVLGLYGLKAEDGGRALSEVLATQPLVLLFYLFTFVAPWVAGPSHAIEWVDSFKSAYFYCPAAMLIVMAVATWASIRRSPRRNLYLFCAAWFLIGIAPSMNLSGLWDLAQDRYLYAPALGIFVILGDAGIRATRECHLRRLGAACLGLVTAAYAIAFWNVHSYWKDTGAYYEYCAKIHPTKPKYRARAEEWYETRGDWKAAKREALILEAMEPDNTVTHLRLEIIYQHLGEKALANQEFFKSMPAEMRK